MDTEISKSVLLIFDQAISKLSSMPKRKREDISDVEVVFADIINGRTKHNSCGDLATIIEALERGGKPIGLLFLDWRDSEKTEAFEFPGISSDEAEALIHALATAQDDIEEMHHDGYEEGD